MKTVRAMLVKIGKGFIVLGAVFLVVLAVRGFQTAMRLEHERKEQKWRTRVQIDLAANGSWVSPEYFPRRTGIYSLNIETQKPGAPIRLVHGAPSFALYRGAFEIRVMDSSGRLIHSFTADGKSLYFTDAPYVHWNSVGYFDAKDLSGSPWRLEVRVTRVDPDFAEMASYINLEPPARIDVGWTSVFAFAELVGWGGLGTFFTAVGAVMIFLGGKRLNAP